MARKNGNVPARRASTVPVPADVMKSIATDSEKASGFEDMGADDLAIPFLMVLQSGSPQVKGSTKIKGAADGMLHNTVSNAVINPPARFVPCFFQKCFVEWVLREKGGGFVASHSDDAILGKCKRNERNQDILPNGNQLVRTAYHYGLLLEKGAAPQPMVLGMSSTQLKRSRRWNSQAMALKLKIGGKLVTPPLYSHSYALNTVEESNEKGTWWSWDIGDPQLIEDAEVYQTARDFHNAVRSGGVRLAPPPSPSDADGAAPSEDDSNVL